MTSVQNLKYSLTNLSRCAIVLTNNSKVIGEENLQDFPLKHNAYIVNSCDQKCVTSPKLWTQLCEKFNFKALTFNQFELKLVKELLKDHCRNKPIMSCINIGKKHAIKKYHQFALNTSCFWGSKGLQLCHWYTVQFHEILLQK